MRASATPSTAPVSDSGSEAIRLKDLGPLRLAIAGLMLITVSRAHDYLGIVGAMRPGLLFFGGALVCLALLPHRARFQNLWEEWPSRAMIALVIVACLSALTGLSITASGAFMLESFSRLLSFFGLLVVVIRSVNDLRFLTATYVVSLTVLVFIVIFVAGVSSFDGYQRIGETAMYDGNDLGVVFLVGLPLALLMAQSGGRVARWLGWLTLVGTLACILLTASRGAFLGLLATAGALLVLIPRVSIGARLAIPVIATAFILVAAPEGYWDKMSTILNPGEDYNLTSDTGRMAIWTRGMGYVAAYPVFGVGPDNFIRAGWEISDVARSTVARGLRNQAPHNTFLQVWAELGTVGLAVWLTVLVGGIVAPIRLRSRMPRYWLKGTPDQRFLYLSASYLPASFVAFATTTFFVSHAYTGMFYIFAAFLSGFLLLVRRELAKAPLSTWSASQSGQDWTTPSSATASLSDPVYSGHPASFPSGRGIPLPQAGRSSRGPTVPLAARKGRME